MIYFTVTATHVAFCWWGHEMMRAGGAPTDQQELFTRVMQFGAWSPVYTNWGNGGEDDNLWFMDSINQDAVRTALLDRAQLMPYRYTLAKVAYDVGLGPLRPMYYESPASPSAYEPSWGQYLLGPDIVVAPVSVPADSTTGLAPVSLWVPPATSWVQWKTASVGVTGQDGTGTWLNLSVPISIVPAYVRAGAIIPMTPLAQAQPVGAAAQQYSALQFDVYPFVQGDVVVFPAPAGSSASAWVYEDDGISNDYSILSSAQVGWANTTIAYTVGADLCMEATIQTSGSYAGAPVTRAYSVWRKGASVSPAQVTVDGSLLPQGAADGLPNTWYRDPQAGNGAADLRAYFPAQLTTTEAHTLRVCW